MRTCCIAERACNVKAVNLAVVFKDICADKAVLESFDAVIYVPPPFVFDFELYDKLQA